MTMALGRESDVDAIRSCLEASASGARQIVVLDGDPGIGKTTLVREAARMAEERGFTVLSCRPAEAEAQLAFGGLADLLEPVPSTVLDTLPDAQRTAVDAALLRAASDLPVNQRAVAAALTATLRAMAQDAPVAVVVDDLQWLDRPSAAALAFATRRLDADRVLVLLARRPSADGSLDALGLDHGLSNPPLRRRLGPLTLSALYHVIRGRTGLVFSRPVLQRIADASMGNPLFAIEVALALDAAGPVRPDEPLPVPESLGGLIHARLARLPARCREALLVCASVPNPTASLVERVVEGDAATVLDDAAAAGVVELRGDRVTFAHPLFASELRAAATASARRTVHARLAAVVEDATQRARHLALAAEGPSEPVAAAVLDAARGAAARGATVLACELLALACELTPRDDAELMATRRLELAEANLRAGDTAEVVRLVDEVLDGSAPGRIRARALELEARVLHVTSTAGEAVARCDEALANAVDDVQLLARVHATRALVGYDDISAARHHARVALDLLAQARDPDPAVEAQAILAFAAAEVDLGHGIPMAEVERGLELERKAPAPSVGDRLSASLGAWLKYVGRLDEAREWLERTHRAATEEGDEGSAPYALSHLPQLELWAGRWVEAERRALEHHELSERTGQDGQRVQALYNLALVHAHLGRIDEAVTEIDAARGACVEVGDRWALMPLAAARGFIHLSLGEHEAAVAELELAAEIAAATGVGRARREAVDHAEALVACGRLDDARALIAETERAARGQDHHEVLAGCGRALALLAAADVRLDDALAALDGAMDAHGRSGEPFGRARTDLVLGQVLRRRGERRAAGEALSRALAAFEALGARVWAERAREELGRVPLRRRVATLTAAEHRVADLAARGLPNREIAQALFVTTKTVEANLTRAYAKLGVRSRAELAATWGARAAEAPDAGAPGGGT